MSHLTEEQSNQLYLQLLEEKLGLEHHFATNDHFGLSNSFKDSTVSYPCTIIIQLTWPPRFSNVKRYLTQRACGVSLEAG